MRPGGPLPLVQTEIHAAHDRWIGSEVLLHRTSPTVLDRGAALDDAGDRGGSTLGRLPKGVSHERARCLRGHSAVEETFPIAGAYRVNLQTESFRGLDDRFTPPRSGARLPTWLLNNLSPRNRAFGYRRVVTLIGIAPIPNSRRGCTGIREVIVAVVITTIIGSGR